MYRFCFKIITLLLLSIIIIQTYCQYIRKSADELTYDEWKAYKKGIDVMKKKGIRDPLGFYFQANIHGWNYFDGSEYAIQLANELNWNKCQHAQYFFLVWHRMYLYFFEKILRNASGNPNLALPYWDYSLPEKRQLPQVFRIPANEKYNPLYTVQRCRNLNEGQPLDAKTTDPYPALTSQFFAVNKSNELNLCNSFGGGRIDAPSFASDREGLTENMPHDYVHVNVGGPGGYMSDLCNAARDPIFFSHHCMIDRIWESWIQNGGRDLNEPNFLNQNFTFYDETGQLKNWYVRDFLDISKLGYRYSSLLKPKEKIEVIVPNENPELFISVDETEDLVINSTKHSIYLKIRPNFLQLFRAIAMGKIDEKRIKFTLQTQLGASLSGLLFELYLNLPQETHPYIDLPNHIGSITNFQPECIPRIKRSIPNLNSCFEITRNLFTVLRNNYNYNGILPDHFNLTIVPMSCDTMVYPEDQPYIIYFNRTLLIHYYQ